MYQGHHPDGSSIQKHSAGSHYPFVIGKREGSDLPWFVLHPDSSESSFATSTGAFRYAQACADLRKT